MTELFEAGWREDFLRERRRLLFERNSGPTIMGMVLAAIIVWLLWSRLPQQVLLIWLAVKFMSAGTRLTCELFWRRASKPSDSRLEHFYLTALAVDGLVWGALGLLVAPSTDFETKAIVMACLLGVTAIGVMVLSMHFVGSLLFNGATLLPTAVMHLLQGGTVNVFTGLALIVFLAISIPDARRVARTYQEMLRLRFTLGNAVAAREDALRLAQAGNEVKTRFLATISHEMRTPLHVLLGMIEIMMDRPSTAEDRRDFELLHRSCHHLLSIINDVLDLSRIEADGLHLDQKPFDLDRAVEEIVALQRTLALHKGLRLSLFNSKGRVGLVMGDEARLRQIVVNLLGNAIKFTDQGQISVIYQPEESTIKITVIDTGCGIPPAVLPHVFDAFVQGDGSYTRRHGGTGLGLSISRQLARAMGGELSCESAPGHGSTFELVLPLRVPTDAELVPSAARHRLSADDPTFGVARARRILLVEDNEISRGITTTLLIQLGLEVEAVGDGAQAVAAYERLPPDLVLMDLQMPLLDGLAATREIRALEERLNLPRTVIIAVSASVFEQDRANCLAAGMDGHLAKPFSQLELRLMLEQHLPLFQLSRPAAAASAR